MKTFFEAMDFRALLLLRLVLAVSAASIGAFLAVAAKKVSHEVLCLLISFAAGALLAVAFFDILPESVAQVGMGGAALSVVLGYVFFWGVTRFLFHLCPACSATHTEINFTAVTWTMVAALGVHSFMDGLAIYTGYVSGSAIGILMLLAVIYHKFPEGMALACVAVGSGMGRARAFSLAIGLEAFTTLAGGAAGFLVLWPETTPWLGYALGCVAGSFIYLVVHALLTELLKHQTRSTILAALAGGASMVVAGWFLA